MKNILLFLFFFGLSNILLGQGFPIQQNLGSDSTLIRIGSNSKGAIRGSLIPSTYTDTTQANAGRIDDYPFAIIATSGDGNVWQRNYLATGWVLIGGGSDPSGLFFKVGGNLFPVTVPSRNIGTLSPYGGAIGLMTNSVVHAIVPDAGFTLANDTTAAKVFTWNPTSKEWGYANWNNGGGGGATPTLQQVLTAGSTLTTENEINLNRNALLILDSADNRTFVTIDGQAGNQRIILDADDGSLYASSIELSANSSSGAVLDLVCHDIAYETLAISFDGDEEKINYTSPRHSFISNRGGSYTNLVVTQDSIHLLPNQGKLNIDSLRTWSAVSDTTYKKPMTWDTRNGRWEYASNWFGSGGGGSGITVGTTAIASGTAGRVLFQGSGNVLQQEAEFFWNETNNALQIGSPTAVSGYGMLLRQSDNGTTTGVRVISNNQTAYMDVYYAGLLHLGDLLLQGNTSIRLNTATGVTIGANSAPGAMLDIRGRTMTNSRVLLSQGADVASAAGAITLGGDGNSFEITGTSSITAIVNTNWQNGATITLMFTSTATLTDGTANSGTSIGFELAGNTDFTATADDVITLILSEIGGTQRWREVSRSVN